MFTTEDRRITEVAQRKGKTFMNIVPALNEGRMPGIGFSSVAPL
jgi:hypothetical protein